VNGAVRGEMLAVTIQTLLDLAEDRPMGVHMIAAERVNHDAFGTPPEVFGRFYPILRETFRDLLGAEWTAEMEAAWDEVLAKVAVVLS
jgi:hemoglobin-like flavoprotein